MRYLPTLGVGNVRVLSSHFAQGLKAGVKGEDLCYVLTSHSSGPSCTNVAYVIDRACILLLGGDIEVNPGPGENENLDAALEKFGENMMNKFAEMMSSEMRKVHEELSTVSQRLSGVERDLADFRKKIEAQENYMDKVSEEQKEIVSSLKELNDRIEQQEIHSRRDNVLLYGVPELEWGSESHEKSEETFVEVVNQVLSAPLQVTDVVRAHRVGKRAAGKVRPLIARMVRSADKVALLQKRKELKDKGVGVSGDLTERQREDLRRAREDGYFAYFRGGVLHKEARRQQADTNRPQTRSYARALSANVRDS